VVDWLVLGNAIYVKGRGGDSDGPRAKTVGGRHKQLNEVPETFT